MPSSTVRKFTDPDAYHAAIQNAEVEGVVTARGTYRTDLTVIRLHRLWMQRGVESLPRVMNVRASRPGILFVTDQNQPTHHVGGREVAPGEIAAGSDCIYHHRASAASRWGAMSLTAEDLAAAGRTIIGHDLTVPSFPSRVRPDPVHLTRLLTLHEAVGRLAETAPEILAHPEVARAIEQGLVQAMVQCLGGGDATAIRSADRQHAVIMRRFEEVLVTNCDQTLYIGELCGAIGVAERTLLACCHEHLGMGPKKYLLLRRMHLAHRALRLADPATASVTEIATSCGFWELGRFSVAYRKLFGESPSASLHRPPEDPHPRMSSGSPWQLADFA